MEVREYIYLGDDLVAIRERDATTNLYTTRYQHSDGLGSALVETDANRAVLTRTEYEPYGLSNRPTLDGPGYTGHVQDAATGLTYMQQRYYDPVIGRFLSVDPVTAYSSPGTNFNRYWYANGNPYAYTDPDGRWGRWKLIPLPANANTIVTDGNGGIKVHLGNSAGAGRVQKESMKRHEESHKADFYRDADNPEILEAAAPDQAITPEDPIEAAQSEVTGANVEIDYLNSQKNRSQNANEKPDILARIRIMEKYRKDNQDIIEKQQPTDEPSPPPPPPEPRVPESGI